jgi:hypothetical protein
VAGGGRASSAPRPLGTERFPSQGEAESWLGEFYPDLVEQGVRAVTLYEAERRVYGPMSLEVDG